MGVLSRFMSCPEKDQMRSPEGVLRYLRGTTRLCVNEGGNDALQEYADADSAGETDGRRSTAGFIFGLNGGPFS